MPWALVGAAAMVADEVNSASSDDPPNSIEEKAELPRPNQ